MALSNIVYLVQKATKLKKKLDYKNSSHHTNGKLV